MLNLKIREQEEGKEESLKDFLFRTISEFNCDFTGENGEEYACSEALENGYKNNFDYYFEHYKKFYPNEVDLTNAMLNEATNGAYRCFYETAQKDGKVVVIASYVTWD